MEITRMLLLLLSIWTATRAQQQTHVRPLGAPAPENIAALDLTQPTTYPTFITTMRNALSEKDSKRQYVLQCDMQKISSTIPSQRYAYVNIIAPRAQTVTLAIDRTNVYVLGYRDMFNGSERAFFFNEVYDSAKDLFPNAVGDNREKLPYTSQYNNIGNRYKSPLGIYSLQLSIQNIFGKPIDQNFYIQQRKFFLLALQMVAEATRFKYISDKIPVDDKYDNLQVNEYVKALENGWDTLSTAVYDLT